MEDVLVDDEEELPRSCGFTSKFEIVIQNYIFIYIFIESPTGGIAVGRELGEQELNKVLL